MNRISCRICRHACKNPQNSTQLA